METTTNETSEYVQNDKSPGYRADYSGRVQHCVDEVWHNLRSSVHPNGYRFVRFNGRPALLHRVIIHLHVGMDLHSDLVVHHIDGDRENNSISNLLICTIAEHVKLHSHTQHHRGVLLDGELDDILDLRENGMGLDSLRNKFHFAKSTLRNFITDAPTRIRTISI